MPVIPASLVRRNARLSLTTLNARANLKNEKIVLKGMMAKRSSKWVLKNLNLFSAVSSRVKYSMAKIIRIVLSMTTYGKVEILISEE